MRANEFLIELFDRPVALDWQKPINKRNHTLTDAKFMVGDNSGRVRFIDMHDGSIYILFDVNGKTSKTGLGDEIKIFSVVSNAIVEFIKKTSPESFYFYADRVEPTRVKLYNRLAQRLSNVVPYSVEINADNKDKEFSKYVFTKK